MAGAGCGEEVRDDGSNPPLRQSKGSPTLSAHDEVDDHYIYFKLQDVRQFLQIYIYGRSSRALPAKLSQSVQLDRDGARALFKILKQESHFE